MDKTYLITTFSPYGMNLQFDKGVWCMTFPAKWHLHIIILNLVVLSYFNYILHLPFNTPHEQFRRLAQYSTFIWILVRRISFSIIAI